ncbi:Transcription factor [Fulvia fulva]|uniref:Transcription factor n=1 Tax=Passalora fulva TaxID=5499 RepID=A0A9Q8P9R2_PASFU|nr:Transcription factor [Fulvia fulva]KAK4621808.1 Transcription factor [Fulvia fulva]KAK4623438.1 Transcription factor [Fulvia fulva]UJO18539.1 Transcription factor [Fulvia fulva]WPV15746.1 Transcription factor [Fulvia fulva]WPV31024.1 Transcription factor [Fulvia fulva]
MAPILVSSAAPGKKAAPKAAARRRPAAAAPGVVSTPAPSAQQTTPSVAPSSPPPAQPSIVQQPTSQEEQQAHPPSVQQAQSQQKPESTPASTEPVRQPSPQAEQVRVEPPTGQHAPIVQITPLPTKDATSEPIAETTSTAASSAAQPIALPSQLSQVLPNSLAASQQQTPETPSEAREEPALSFAEQALGPLLQPIPGQTENASPVSQLPTDESNGNAANVTKSTAKTGRGTKRARAAEEGSAGTTEPRKAPKRSTARSNARVQAVVQGEDQVGEENSVTAGPDETNGEAATSAEPGPAKKRRATTKKTTTTQRKGKPNAKSAETITNSDDEGASATVPEQEMQIDPALTGEVAAPTTTAPKPKKAAKPRKARIPRKKVQISAQDSAEPVATQNADTEMDVDAQDVLQQDGEDDSSDLENHVIDPDTVSMWDISHDTRHGKRSERGKAMAAIDWEKVKKERKAAAQAIVDGLQPKAKDTAAQPAEDVVPTTEGAEEADGTPAEEAPDQDAEPSEQPATETADPNAEMSDDDDGLHFIMDENGDIILDPDKTTTIDNTQAARDAAANVEDAQVVDDLTMLNNRTTWINENRRDPIDRVPLWKWKSDPWSEDETDRFYDQLRMFGTDFFIISKMFPGKNRRMIKAKFTREEKLDPARIDAALTGTSMQKWSLEHYARETGIPVAQYTQFQTLEHTMSIINEETQKKHEIQAAEDERKAAEREREEKEKAAADKEKRKSAKKAKRTRQKAAAAGTLGGGPDD